MMEKKQKLRLEIDGAWFAEFNPCKLSEKMVAALKPRTQYFGLDIIASSFKYDIAPLANLLKIKFLHSEKHPEQVIMLSDMACYSPVFNILEPTERERIYYALQCTKALRMVGDEEILVRTLDFVEQTVRLEDEEEEI